MVSRPNVVCGTIGPLRIALTLAIVATLSLLVTGCSVGDGSSDPGPEATSRPTVEPAPPPAVELGPVVWTTSLSGNGEATEDLDTIPRDADAIHAVVPVESVPAGETLTANWALDGVAIDAVDSTVTLDGTSESGWVSFSLAWEGETLWPVGTLEITITARSGATVTGAVEIESA